MGFRGLVHITKIYMSARRLLDGNSHPPAGIMEIQVPGTR